ncbi:aspartyl protease family protein [Roseateles violae]|uniref:Aspartyl protease family protein n=1 Tax=Roseateles violae TaxID=3058042 RepID=A0ABT8DX14_9BURK|nr:aspartyl protease family protein [Pelomonas sp. PFR6]MDN3921735.1 aspartyl protease family protein [Pelomonas sp. PFR6]
MNENKKPIAAGLAASIRRARRLCLSGAMLLGLAAMTDPAAAACKLSALEMPITMVGSRAVATLGINGSKVPMMVDSGAFYSMLSHAAAQQLQLKLDNLPWGLRIEGITGEIEARQATVKRLQLLGGEIPDIDFIVGGNADLGNGTMGLIGRNILAFTDIEYDLANGVIRLMFPNDDCGDKAMAYWARDKPFSVLPLLRDESRSKTPAIRALAKLNGKTISVLFDTGAQSLVSLQAAKQAGIGDMKPAGKIHGAGRGEADRWTATAGRFELGDEAISNIGIAVADFKLKDEDMLLGIDFFLSHRIYVSKKQRRMYFTYNGGPVFALSSSDGAAQAAGEEAGEPPSDAAGYARRGAAAAARRDYARALADLDRACEMAPEVADYLVRRGAVHERMRKAKLALADYERALRLEPTQAEARLRRVRLRTALGERSAALEDLQALDRHLAPQATQRLEMAQLYYELGQSQGAMNQWALWISAHPHDIALGSALNSRCWARTMLNTELDAALADCDKAIDLEEKNGAYYDSRGWLRLRRDELRKAVSDFDRALKLKPDSAWSLYGRGIARRKLGDLGGAQLDLDAARKLDPAIDEATGKHGLAADPKPAAPTAAASAATSAGG